MYSLLISLTSLIFGVLNLQTSQSFLKRAAKVSKFVLIGISGCIFSLVFLFPQLFNCEVIRYSEFTEGYRNIFFSPEIKKSQYVQIRNIVSKAEMRIDSFYAGRISRPIIIVCSNTSEYEKYCNSSEGAGCSIGSPYGSAFIILNTEGVNVDVVSHEMSHIELFKRIGWWKITVQVPQWFNEGVALMVDQRFVNNPDRIGRYLDYMDEWLYYTRGGQEIRELENISSIKEFFSGSQQSIMLSYMTSGLEVSYWLIYLGNEGLPALIKRMQNGDSFSKSYSEVERSSKITRMKNLPKNPLRITETQENSE